MAVTVTMGDDGAVKVSLPEIGDKISIDDTDIDLELVVDDPETGHTRIVVVDVTSDKILFELPWLK